MAKKNYAGTTADDAKLIAARAQALADREARFARLAAPLSTAVMESRVPPGSDRRSVNVSLNEAEYGRLESRCVAGESVTTCATRLLLEVL